MRTGISKVVMCVATFMLLLMSAIPHHHHCTEADTFRHIDYICFADNGAIEGDACDDCNSDHEVNHDMEHSHEGGHVHLHSIVTIERYHSFERFKPHALFACTLPSP